MCGIIAFIAKDNKAKDIGKEVITQYQRQHERGNRGFGVMDIGKKAITIERATEPVKALLDLRFAINPIVTLHHRYPTSTNNDMEQTHPFHISHNELEYDYQVIHNGVIRNNLELFKTHTEELGYTYKTLVKGTEAYTTYPYKDSVDKFNDSEALAIEIARYFEGKTNEIGALGTIAFITYKLDKKTQKPLEMIWGRNSGNPLEMVETDKGILLASQVYDIDAESINDNTFEVIDLVAYFKAKKSFKDVRSLIKTGDLTFRKEVTVSKTIGFDTSAFETTTTINLPSTTTTISDTLDDDGMQMTSREVAFSKMAERIISEVEDQIHDMFAEMAYGDIEEERITLLASNLQDTIIEKAEKVKSVVRPYFDKEEEEGYPDYNADYDIKELDDNQRTNASIERFNEMML